MEGSGVLSSISYVGRKSHSLEEPQLFFEIALQK